LAFAIPNYVHRVFTTLAANLFFSIATVMIGAPGIATAVAAIGTALIWLDQVRMAQHPALWKPLGYGFVIALLHLDGSLLIGSEFWSLLLSRDTSPPVFLIWTSVAVSGLVFLYVSEQLRTRARVPLESRAGILITTAAIVVALVGLVAPGMRPALLVLCVG